MLLKKVVTAAVPTMIAVAAFFQAHAIGSLVDAQISTASAASIAPFAEARAAERTDPADRAGRGSEQILDRNVFDSTARPRAVAETTDVVDGDPSKLPMCDGVRAIVTVQATSPDASFAAIDVAGRRHLRKRGGQVDDLRLMYVGNDRVWLEKNGKLCQAQLYAPPMPVAKASAPGSGPAPGTPRKIERVSPTELVIDRSEVSRILEAQAELMKTPLVPEKEGDQVVGLRLVKVKPDSILGQLGLVTGDRLESFDGISVTNTEGMMQTYARLSAGNLSHLTIHVLRAGKPVNLDYTVK